jgi:hypothetical protein
MTMDEAAMNTLRKCAARDAIHEVLALYCRAIDRCDAELLRRLYWPEAIEDRGYFSGDRDAFVAWVIPQLAGLESTHHQIGLPSIALDGDAADVETYWVGYKKLKPAAGVRDQITGGRYLDRMAARNGEWRILRRTAVADWLTTAEGVAWDAFAFGALHIGKRGAEDRVYRFRSAPPPTG